MVKGARVLLTEGSSLTSREVVTCLGPAGYHLEVLDPDPLCLVRFSRWVSKVHRCAPAGADPSSYVQTLEAVVRERDIDVVLPTHEQAWLLASVRPRLPANVRVAVADASAFARVQSKLAFAELLDELGMPQPRWRAVASHDELADFPFPFWLKAPFSTAGQGVREVTDARSRDAALRALLLDGQPVMAQQHASGQYGQVQGLFDRGRLVAVHTSVQRATGVGGSAAARLSVDHATPREQIAALGETLRWHGGLTLDYLHHDGSPQYIECNPRTVEPANAAASAVNIPELQIRVTLEQEIRAVPRVGRANVRTHGTIALLLGNASRGGSRRSLLREICASLAHRGRYEQSAEQLTPARRDPPSLAPAAFVAGRLLASPRRAQDFAAQAIAKYAVDPKTIAALTASSPPSAP
jgi:hypothetical protein